MWSMLRFVLPLMLVLAALPAAAERITVFAAASLKTALDDIALAYHTKTGVQITPVYAASSVLARQIAAGAPADVFISANAQWMDWLVARSKIKTDSRADVIGNTLVLVGHGRDGTPLSSVANIARTLGNARLAVALINAVPAGIYAKAALDWAGAPADLPLAQTPNVRSALALVARGETPLGIVYASDAAVTDNVSVLYHFPPQAHPNIRYPAAITNTASRAADAFIGFLHAPAAQMIFVANGFEALP